MPLRYLPWVEFWQFQIETTGHPIGDSAKIGKISVASGSSAGGLKRRRGKGAALVKPPSVRLCVARMIHHLNTSSARSRREVAGMAERTRPHMINVHLSLFRCCVCTRLLLTGNMASSSALHPRARHLISLLQLEAHPEGGYFCRIYRSSFRVQPQDDRPGRPALTSIYYLLPGGERSCWHRVGSDEVWHFYEGDPLNLFCAEEDVSCVARHTLGPVDGESRPVRVVPRNRWQAACSTGAYTLVGCTVGPGFDFADFQMLRELPDEAAHLRARQPDFVQYLSRD